MPIKHAGSSSVRVFKRPVTPSLQTTSDQVRLVAPIETAEGARSGKEKPLPGVAMQVCVGDTN